jgi:uncharacterized protein YfiM (DUF2279 family)
MRIETIGRYKYISEFRYDITRHRNMPKRFRLSDELAELLELLESREDASVTELIQDEHNWKELKKDYKFSRAIQIEWDRAVEWAWKNMLPKTNRSNRGYDLWQFSKAIISHDENLDEFKRRYEYEKDARGNPGRMQSQGFWKELAMFAKYAPRYATHAWKEFLETLENPPS